MKKYNLSKNLFIISIIFLILSCNKEKEEMWLSLKNDSQFEMECKLYPTGKTDYSTTHLILSKEYNKEMICSSEDIEYTPVQLINEAFDSIVITIMDTANSNIRILYSIDSGNYDNNPFKNPTLWTLEEIKQDFPTNFSRNTHNIKNYIFAINYSDKTD